MLCHLISKLYALYSLWVVSSMLLFVYSLLYHKYCVTLCECSASHRGYIYIYIYIGLYERQNRSRVSIRRVDTMSRYIESENKRHATCPLVCVDCRRSFLVAVRNGRKCRQDNASLKANNDAQMWFALVVTSSGVWRPPNIHTWDMPRGINDTFVSTRISWQWLFRSDAMRSLCIPPSPLPLVVRRWSFRVHVGLYFRSQGGPSLYWS